MRVLILSLLLSLYTMSLQAQSALARSVSVKAEQQPLTKIMSLLEEEGQFRFSFQSTILPADSLVSLNINRITLADALDQLLGHRYEYRQSGNFVIIRYAPLELKLLIVSSMGNADHYQVTGQVVDKHTDKPVPKASIYEKSLLVAEVSDSSGYFTINMKRITQPLLLTVTKTNYKSLYTHFLAEVNIMKRTPQITEGYVEGNLAEIEKTWLGRALITSNQKIQSANIGNFISRAPVQFSFIPGVNSHGSLSGQVVNKFSLNVIGAYSAGVDGAEIGLLFNINKDKARYFQFGGAFNLVGGDVQGLQIAGLTNYDFGHMKGAQFSTGYNDVQKNAIGLQIGGVLNRVSGGVKGTQFSVGGNLVKRHFSGVQIAGVTNWIGGEVKGAQLSVGINVVEKNFAGLQLGGVANYVGSSYQGVQLAVGLNSVKTRLQGIQLGFFNYAHKQDGLQIGFINLSKETTGYTFGLINLAWQGYHHLELAYNESLGATLSYKSGNPKLYNTLEIGATITQTRQYSTGIGLGKDFALFKSLSFNPEWSASYIYQGNISKLNLLQQLDVALKLKLHNRLALRAGPSANLYHSNQHIATGNFGLLQYKHANGGVRSTWLSWNIGLVAL